MHHCYCIMPKYVETHEMHHEIDIFSCPTYTSTAPISNMCMHVTCILLQHHYCCHPHLCMHSIATPSLQPHTTSGADNLPPRIRNPQLAIATIPITSLCCARNMDSDRHRHQSTTHKKQCYRHHPPQNSSAAPVTITQRCCYSSCCWRR